MKLSAKRASIPAAALGAFTLVVALGAVGGCQLVAGIETRTTDPIEPGCTLPTIGAGHVRFADLVPSDAAVDLCIRQGGGAYKRPVLRGGGKDCPSGFKYSDVTVPFASPTGSIDAKVVTAGDACSGAALSEATGITVDETAVVTLVRVGGSDGAAEQLVALPESSATDATNTRLRFVNAVPGVKPLYLGIAKDAHLPTQITAPILNAPVALGAVPTQTPKPSAGTVDDHGYLAILPVGYQLGAAEEGSTKALLADTVAANATTYSMFAIGSPSDNRFPVRALRCLEATPASGATSSIKATCTLSGLATLSVDVFNVGLYGPNAPVEAARRTYLIKTLATSEADLQCLLETARKTDRDAIIGAAKTAVGGSFDFSYVATTDLSTAPTDPRDQNGNTPAPPSTPPCAGSVPRQDVDDVYACLVANCSTKPGDGSGVLAGDTSCLSQHCTPQFLPLLNDHPACFDCIGVNVESQVSFDQGKLACTTDVRPPLGFQGETPALMLSRYPLSNQDVFVLPSTNFRRVVLYSQVTLQDQTTVDFYCGFLSSTLISSTLPYDGAYGNGDPATGYDQEQLLQAQRLIDWVRTKSGKRPAIITGDWHSSIAVTQAGTKIIDAVNPQTLKLLRDAFASATAPTWVPSCSYCPASQNAYNGDLSGFGLLLQETFVFNWPANATTDETRIYDKAVVPLPPNGPGMLSPYFGLNVRVLRP